VIAIYIVLSIFLRQESAAEPTPADVSSESTEKANE
jgi:hypothetical protein